MLPGLRMQVDDAFVASGEWQYMEGSKLLIENAVDVGFQNSSDGFSKMGLKVRLFRFACTIDMRREYAGQVMLMLMHDAHGTSGARRGAW